jgi:hypothetical protein
MVEVRTAQIGACQVRTAEIAAAKASTPEVCIQKLRCETTSYVLGLLAQEADSGFDLRATARAGAFYSPQLTASPRVLCSIHDANTGPDHGFFRLSMVPKSVTMLRNSSYTRGISLCSAASSPLPQASSRSVAAIALPLCLIAELLPIRSYSTVDGLAANRIDCILGGGGTGFSAALAAFT